METQYFDRNTRNICIVCILSNLSFYPLFQQSSYARYIVIGLWGVQLLLSFLIRYIPTEKNGFTTEILLFVAFSICSGITFLCGGTKVFSNHFFSVVVVAMAILFIGYMNGGKIGRYGLNTLCLSYMHTMFIISVPLFFFYLRGTDLTSIYYSYSYGKNEIATLLLCAVIFGIILYSPQSFICKCYKIGGTGMCILDLVFLRCRTAILCIVICLSVIILLGKMVNKGIKAVVSIFVVAVLAVNVANAALFDSFLNDVIFAGRSGTLDSLTSGRVTQIYQGFEVFTENIFTGVGYRETLDCFFVSALANYGIGAWSIIALAISPLIWAMRNVWYGEKIDIAFLLVAISMIITGCFEELAPFGTGTRCYILWLMWGVLLRTNYPSRNSEEIQG